MAINPARQKQKSNLGFIWWFLLRGEACKPADGEFNSSVGFKTIHCGLVPRNPSQTKKSSTSTDAIPAGWVDMTLVQPGGNEFNH
jgi:hypothetical protein